MRFRKTDLFAVVGVLLLVVWVPGYVGQGENERDLSDGYEFGLPAPRDGDVVELELVYSETGQAPVSIGPVLRREWHAVDPRQDPDGAVFMERSVRLPLEARFGIFHYHAASESETTYFGPGGDVLRLEDSSVTYTTRDDGTLVERTRERARMAASHDPYARLISDAARRIDFETSLVGLIGAEVSAFAVEMLSGEAEGAARSDKAATYRDRLLFGDKWWMEGPLAPKVWTSPTGGGEYRAGDRIAFWNLFANGVSGGAQLRLLEPMRYGGSENWVWYSPDVPVLAGEHRAFLPVEGGVTRIFDLVPSRVRLGQGEPFTAVRRDEFYPLQVEPTLKEPLLPTTSYVEALGPDVPLLRGISTTTLVQALQHADAPEAARTMMRDGGRLAGFTWRDVGRPQTTASTGMPAPLDGMVPGDRTFVSDWNVHITDVEGRLLTVAFTLQERYPDGTFVAGSFVECPSDGSGFGLKLVCDRFSPETFDPQRQVVAPDVLLEHIVAAEPRFDEAASTGSDTPYPDSFSYLPFRPFPQYESHALGDHAGVPAHGGIARWHLASDAQDGRVWSREGAYRLDDGRVVRSEQVDERSVMSSGVVEVQATAAAPVKRLDVVPAHLAEGGLVLVFIAVLVRAVAWMHTGGIPLFAASLFSRIHRDTALDHKRRADMMALIESDPGVTMTEISGRLAIGRGAALHHLATLKRNGLIADHVEGRKRHWVKADLSTLERTRTVFMRDPNVIAVLDRIGKEPGLTLEELAQRVGQDLSAASRLGGRLEREGLLRKERAGRHVRFYPTR